MVTHPDPRKGPVDRTPPTGRLTVTHRANLAGTTSGLWSGLRSDLQDSPVIGGLRISTQLAIAATLLFAGCGGGGTESTVGTTAPTTTTTTTTTAAPTTTTTPDTTSTITTTTTTEPPRLDWPDDVGASHLGHLSPGRTGGPGSWRRPHPGPFQWGLNEPSPGRYA